ncbi:NAD(P)H-dependent glycerol-3-phosphate dehydrogenase [Ruegeria sp. HKCCD6228]|uniref:Glycerol-3-phosphate dehydrogenase [NAD(P)+] n=1 Tax=Ruegeria atlantica TaxID=81569 RepID=A0AA90YXS7_9RHOB|nr:MULTISPECIES: NAD(P)H-dependent glycerol-3-phosphate dehydrogenase [Ruegeria]NOC93660.1 NAD(P)H-dependent glycerol-3-phosphate dehydrogenase [Ruegeria sp. HKCCD6604]NOD96513.1 NAD(P)H-dependent glycerol-3-phosphate dehydrogenase [Ruegeria sp. HKCCD6228]NOE19248.1 NAD(P)H-dependent glycerol-3-phosphate dehydrogenase [Ruegeria atlantica]
MSVSVLGSGAFGTALAISLAGNGPVTLWSRNADRAQQMRETRENATRLPNITLPGDINVTGDIAKALRAATLLLAVPMQKLRSALQDHAPALRGKTLVACCKGIELTSGLGPVAVIKESIPDARVALLTGPSFADDIAHGLPTALTLACEDTELGKALQAELTTANLRLYRTTDTIGAELGGALKNVMAIGCGAAIGAGLGDSARAALMTRGFAEMQRFAAMRGARPDTLMGLSGLGDLVLTCSSELSRNYRFGLSLGLNQPFDSQTTVEGVATARAMSDIAAKEGLDMPISATVADLSHGAYSVTEAIQNLLNRPLKEE